MAEHVGIVGPGFSFGGQNTSASTLFRHLGPFPGGLIVERVVVNSVCDGVTVGSFSPVLTASPDENQATFQSGQALITRAASTLLGKPAFSFVSGGGIVVDWEIPLGIRIQTGTQFILCGLANALATSLLWNVSLFTVLVADRRP